MTVPQVSTHQLRYWLVGDAWTHLVTSLFVGVAFAACLDNLVGIVFRSWQLTAIGSLPFAVALSVGLTYTGAGLISTWLAGFSFSLYTLLYSYCVSGVLAGQTGLCGAPPPLVSFFLEAIPIGIVTATIGYVLTKISQDDIPIHRWPNT